MPAEKLINQLFNTITGAVDSFDSSIPAIQQDMLDEVSLLLKDLDLTSGRIAPSVANLRTVAKAQGKLERIVLENKEYKDQVASYMDEFGKISDLNAGYFTELESKFKPSSLLREMEKQSISSTIESLTGAGISSNVADPVYDLIRQNVTTGTKYTDLVKSLSNYIKGQGETLGSLDRYVKQITTDALNQFSANYMEIAASDLNLKWYQYSGVRIETSRKFCVAMMRKKHYHKVEIPDLIKGRFPQFAQAGGSIYQNTGLPHGMVKGTNVENFQIYRGGYNCQHQAIPVAESSVPAKTRRAVYAKYNIPANEKGFADSRGVVPATPAKEKSPAPVVKLGFEKKFDDYMIGINPNAARVINKTRKPRYITDGDNIDGSYYSRERWAKSGDSRPSGYLVSEDAEGAITFRHEYGHHLDYNIDPRSVDGNIVQRSLEQDFIKAADDDLKALKSKFRKEGKSAGEMYEYFANRWRSKELSGASDMMDALSGGQVFSKYRGWGHGKKYYRTTQKRQAELFANLFEGYATRGNVWDEINENFPNLVEVFEKTMNEVISR